MYSSDEPLESPMNDVSRPDPVLRARDLMPAIAADADETERLRRIPAPLLDRLHEARLFRMLYPGADQRGCQSGSIRCADNNLDP
jgi:hypothetical protein